MAKTTRDKLLTNAKVGPIEFVAASVSGGGTARRLAIYEAIGVDGAELEDLGQGPRREVLKARLDEGVWQKLENLKRDGKAVQCVHPLFGVFTGRVESCPYEAGPKSLVDCTITLIEDGQHTVQLAPITLSLPDAASAFSAGLDDLDGLAMPDEWTDAQGNYGFTMDSFSDFDSTLSDVMSGGSSWTDLGSAFDSLVDTVDSVVTAVEGEIRDLGQAGADMMDTALDLANKARQCVDAAQDELATVWEPFQVRGSLSVAELARDWLGSDDDDAIDQILDSNPSIIDINSIPEGMDILIPIAI